MLSLFYYHNTSSRLLIKNLLAAELPLQWVTRCGRCCCWRHRYRWKKCLSLHALHFRVRWKIANEQEEQGQLTRCISEQTKSLHIFKRSCLDLFSCRVMNYFTYRIAEKSLNRSWQFHLLKLSVGVTFQKFLNSCEKKKRGIIIILIIGKIFKFQNVFDCAM